MVQDRKHIIIVGGGASGVLLACHLLREGGESISITLVEKRKTVGLGTAYSTSHPSHLLNVRASNMSAFADDPGHFERWLAGQLGYSDEVTSAGIAFAPRGLYGRYISGLIDTLDPGRKRLRVVDGDAEEITKNSGGVSVAMTGGQKLSGDFVVLATGFADAPEHDSVIRNPWSAPAAEGLAPEDPVVILGTGLTMVDLVVELRAAGHVGAITAISRRGLLSQTHRLVAPLPMAASDIPIGKSITVLWRWLRDQAEIAEERSGDWRGAVDGLRPYTAEIWRRLPIDSKRRFLRHARPWWDVHRHRMAPAISADIAGALAWDQLRIVAANILAIETNDGRAVITYRPRGQKRTDTLEAARVFPCMGVSTNPATTRNAVLVSLVKQGLARADELGLGLDIAQNCALKGADSIVSDRIFAVGPITRGAYWEMIAVPDIRLQCAALATQLIHQSGLRDELQLAS